GDDDPDDVPRRAPDGTGHADRKLGGSKEGAREADRGLRGVPRAARDGDPRPREDGGPDGQEVEGPPRRPRRRVQGEDGPRSGPRQGHAQDRDEGGLPAQVGNGAEGPGGAARASGARHDGDGRDRKSTRLNSSHVKISYAVF